MILDTAIGHNLGNRVKTPLDVLAYRGQHIMAYKDKANIGHRSILDIEAHLYCVLDAPAGRALKILREYRDMGYMAELITVHRMYPSLNDRINDLFQLMKVIKRAFEQRPRRMTKFNESNLPALHAFLAMARDVHDENIIVILPETDLSIYRYGETDTEPLEFPDVDVSTLLGL